MKKVFLVLVGLVLSSTAFATDSDIDKEVLKLLMKEASAITLVDGEDGSVLSDEYQLPELFVQYLASYLPYEEGSFVMYKVGASCEVVPTNSKIGLTTYDCQVGFNNGDFSVKHVKDGALVSGAEAESSLVLNFKVIKTLAPGAKPVLRSKTIKAFFAG